LGLRRRLSLRHYGILLVMMLIRDVLKINIKRRAERFEELRRSQAPRSTAGPGDPQSNLDGGCHAERARLVDQGVVASRLKRGGPTNEPAGHTGAR